MLLVSHLTVHFFFQSYLFQFIMCNKILKYLNLIRIIESLKWPATFRMIHEFLCLTFEDVKDQYVYVDSKRVGHKMPSIIMHHSIFIEDLIYFYRLEDAHELLIPRKLARQTIIRLMSPNDHHRRNCINFCQNWNMIRSS